MLVKRSLNSSDFRVLRPFKQTAWIDLQCSSTFTVVHTYLQESGSELSHHRWTDSYAVLHNRCKAGVGNKQNRSVSSPETLIFHCIVARQQHQCNVEMAQEITNKPQ